MSNWQEKLAGLNKDLQAQERAVTEKKAAVLAAFRKRLTEIEPVLKHAVEFGDAFGADCAFEISRFDQRYPSFRFRIVRPALEYSVECRDGVLHERLKEGAAGPRSAEIPMETVAPRQVEQRVTRWIQAAAQSNRRVPGR